ncbi:copper amine oxidase N-terminal domain-containing protein [Paenibacillus sp. GCM10028914]|uniref:copper amine oxidase N-terminal domain-containing protein n=1 Tax=Paenibacillus sp. GCM10028914 TaxID=3273416 RepID=UPI0036137B0E
MKKLLSSLVAAVLISSALYIPNQSPASAAPATTFSVHVDEQMLRLDTYPVIKNETPFLPLYMTREWAGVTLKWNQKNKVVTVLVDGKRYEIKNGSRNVVSGDTIIKLDSAAYIINGRVMIPTSLMERMMGAKVVWQEKYHNVLVNSKGKAPLAVAEGRSDVKLYGRDLKDGVYKGLELEIAGKRHRYNWETPTGWKEVPELIVSDLNQDGESEVVVLLNQGSGTGIHAQDIHVISMKDFKEIPIESQKETVKKWVSTELKKEGDMLHASIQLKGKGDDVILQIPDLEFVEQSEMGFGAVVYHRVENNKLIVRLGGMVHFSMFIGDLEITYAFKEGRYVADKLQFIPFDEYKPYVQKSN